MKELDVFLDRLLRSLCDDGKLPVLRIENNPQSMSDEEAMQQEDYDCLADHAGRTFHTVDTASYRGLRRYTQLVELAALISQLKAEDSTMMLRDVYYTLKHVFESQDRCNSCIMELGKLLHLKRHEMNIIPSSKGIVCGPLQFKFSQIQESTEGQNAWIVCTPDRTPDGSLIDSRWTSVPISEIAVELNANVKFIIVVEKEAIYHRLLQDGLTDALSCILIASCGYPDMATKAMVSKLSQRFPSLPVLGLCDYNPHGLALLLSFRYYSSTSLAFEAEGFACPIRWLGLRSHHVRNMVGLSSDLVDTLQALTRNDLALLQSLRRRDFLQHESMICFQQELDHMEEGGVKCELEALYTLGFSMVSDFVRTSACEGDFI